MSIFQPSQSSSAMPSSREMIGYFSTKSAYMSTICSRVMTMPRFGR